MRYFSVRFCQSACHSLSLAFGLVAGMGAWMIAPALGFSGDRPNLAAPIVINPMDGAIAPTPIEFQIAQQLNFNVDNVRPSRGRAGGFSRGNACFENATEASSPIALVPLDTSTDFARLRVETTVDAQPTFYVFLPEMDKSPEFGELLIFEQSEDNMEAIVHSQTLPLPQAVGAGSIPINIADDFALEMGITYRWTVEVLCSLEDRSSNVFAEGWVERVEPSDGLSAMLVQSEPELYPELYATAGHWYDALEALATLRQRNPNNPTLQNDWAGLLSSVNLGDIANYPLLNPVFPIPEQPTSHNIDATPTVGG
ncbi:DUF928 domain-containing protein [Vacuolonema iberomarrocanum]|uniref:DUF928 domain-containing protein n=1 Tax=Vacuolonema iberomarrocanum TaxID=3454632 RepID=UPI001A017069|nr:DUF928 domain-containing protein [filamentous cyanobacterium LEGE 07170]